MHFNGINIGHQSVIIEYNYQKYNNMKKITFLLSVLVLGFITTHGQETKWVFDAPHTSIQFAATHMGISEVNGKFKDFSGTILSDKADFTDAEINIIIKANSIDTDNDKRDDHLKSEDFLYVENYPEIKFQSSSLEQTEGKAYKMKGELTIRGVTHKVSLDVEYYGTVEAMGETRAGFKVTGTINRFDYDVDWNKTFTKGMVVSKEIDIICNVELIKQ